jgi:hypothetical protein
MGREPAETGDVSGSKSEAIAGFVLLLVRGLLLWLVIPLAFISWLLLAPARALLGRPYVAPGKVIGWADLNLIAAIGQLLVRPFGRRVDFTPWSELMSVDHRVSLIDPW